MAGEKWPAVCEAIHRQESVSRIATLASVTFNIRAFNFDQSKRKLCIEKQTFFRIEIEIERYFISKGSIQEI